MSFPGHEQASVTLATEAPALFDWLDDPRHLGSHMERRSWRTLGTTMGWRFDRHAGRALGAAFRLEGNLWGLQLAADEVVSERQPPARKRWHTVGMPRLLVIGAYRMGFEIAAAAGGSRLTVGIDYEAPRWRPAALARWAARSYARWCVRRMAHDAATHFERARPTPP